MRSRRITSRKRQAVYDCLCEYREHPTAEMLFNRLKNDYPELSLGTVYRNLAVLEQEGLVIRIGNTEGQEHYDARLDTHAHFVCSRCHRVSDIELGDEIEKLVGDVEREYDCKVETFMLNVKGICAKCRNADIK